MILRIFELLRFSRMFTNEKQEAKMAAKHQRMTTTNDIKMDIINLITRINDIDKLKSIYKSVEQVEHASSEAHPDFREGVVEIREGVSFEEILKEQNYKPITYQEFRAIADQIEWEHSLEELLAALD